MAEKSGFFNSSNGDRKYKAEFFAEYFASFIGNGIFPNPSTGLQVVSNNDMTVTLKAGKAWINGYYYCNDSGLILNLDNADGVLNRIDKIVLRFDTLNRTIVAVIKKGSFATSPIAPTIQRDANAYELALADIYISKGAINISQSSITDLRLDNTKCGVVHGTVDQVDTTTLFIQYQSWLADKKAQYDADMTAWTAEKKADYEEWFNTTTTTDQNVFNIWFDGIKEILSGDVVGNLTAKLREIPIFPIAQGTANAIILNDFELVDGNSRTFRIADDNNAASTTINEKPLYKPNTTTPPNLTKGKAVTVWYDIINDAFFIKASAEGNTIAAHVLAGDSFSNDNDTALVGTMPDNGGLNITPAVTAKTIPQGYTDGGIVAGDSNLVSANIKAGKIIFGVAGKPSVVDTADGTITAGQMLSGAAGYANGNKITGAIPSKGATTITPGTSNQTISANQYLTGIQTVLGDPELNSSNIVSGVNIFGVAGNVNKVQYASGTTMSTVTNTTNKIHILNLGGLLSFNPDFVFCYFLNGYYCRTLSQFNGSLLTPVCAYMSSNGMKLDMSIATSNPDTGRTYILNDVISKFGSYSVSNIPLSYGYNTSSPFSVQWIAYKVT